jgi:short-subunit dehydrogenase
MTRNLNDMVVVITGASAGIGKTLAEKLSAKGAKLVLSARRLDRLHALNQQLGAKHLCVAADVSKREDCARLIEEAFRAFGRIDTLICNSGYGIYKAIHETSSEEYHAIFQTNFFGTVEPILSAVPRMLKQAPRDGYRGQVMIVSSIVALHGTPYLGAYSATKSAQFSIAHSMRVELAPEKLAVTTVHPIQTRTDFGLTARSEGGLQLPKGPFGQNVDQVVNRMIGAIIHPRAEVWPHEGSKWLYAIGSLFPKFADYLLGRYRDRVRQTNLQLFRN